MQPESASRHRGVAAGFTVIELLTVIAIIALLVAILVPSLTGARTQAKVTKTQAILHTLNTGLETFKAENRKEFRATNGYPRSARGKDVHEKIRNYGPEDTMYGAQWLVRHLMGRDFRGFVPRRAVPPELRDNEQDMKEWYELDAFNDAPLERVGPYVAPESVDLVATADLPGQPGSGARLIDRNLEAPVVADVFGYAILYYASNPYGRVIATPTQEPDDDGRRGIYVHEDNIGFTGSDQAGTTSNGWGYFGDTQHELRRFGFVEPEEIDTSSNTPSFAHYICDKGILEPTHEAGHDHSRRTVRRVKSDSYLLISPGFDGIYGTDDDITNFGQ